jgi:histone H2A
MAGKKSKGKIRRSGKGTKKDVVSHSKKCGTLYPVSRLNRYLKQGRYSDRVGKSAGAFMAAVLEYLTAEILELAGDLMHDQGKKIIMPRHINLGIRQDEELAKLVSHILIHEGGQVANINHALIPEKKRKAIE